MRTSPSIAPNGLERDIYLVLEDFGRLGRAWRETDEDATDRETLTLNLLSGEYKTRSASWPSTPPNAGLVT